MNLLYSNRLSAVAAAILFAVFSNTAFAQQSAPAPIPAAPDPRASAKALAEVKLGAEHGIFRPNWESIGENYRVPPWYEDAKFGIFIHWGAYAVPAFATEWYPREMYVEKGSRRGIFEHHRKTWGSPDKFGYKDFIPMFKAEKFDPAAWAKLFKESGARYVVPVAEHHDGFPMYDSAYTEWSAAKMGPKRDLIAAIAEAVRAEGLVFGLSSHRAEHWWFYGGGRQIPSDVQDERYRALYGPARDRKESEAGKTPPDQAFVDDWLLRTAELVDKYQPSIVWFDWWVTQPAFHPNMQTFAAYYYNQAANWPHRGSINFKAHRGGDHFPETAGVLDIERGGFADTRPRFWQTDTSVSKNSWGYTTTHDYKNVDAIIDNFVDIVSKNGSLLLNIGPRADGTIPEREQEMLREIGAWLRINGEAIYGTRPWKKFGEGPTQVVEGTFSEKQRRDFTPQDVRYTAKGDTIYATLLGWPGAGTIVTLRSLTLDAFPTEITRILLLGDSQPLAWERTLGGLNVTLPARPPGSHAHAIRIETRR